MLLGLLLLLLLALLFVPCHVRVRARSDLAADDWESPLLGRAEASLRLRWGLLLLTAGAIWSDGALQSSEVRVMGRRMDGRARNTRRPGAGRKPRGGPEGRPGQRGDRKSGRRRSRTDLELVLAVLRDAARLPGRLWRSLGVRFAAEGTYGFPDPSLTGFCEAVRWSTGLGRALSLTPDFQRPCLIGAGELSGRLYGFRLLRIAWQVARNPVIWNRIVGNIRFRPLRAILLKGGF